MNLNERNIEKPGGSPQERGLGSSQSAPARPTSPRLLRGCAMHLSRWETRACEPILTS